MIRFVFLDLDGVLLDFASAEKNAVKQTLAAFSLPNDDDTAALYSRLNDACWRMLEQGKIRRERLLLKRFEDLLDALGAQGDAEAINRAYRDNLSRRGDLLPGAKELLREIQPYYRLYAASNGNAAVQRGRLAAARITAYFDHIFLSEEIGWDKPQKEFFEACFRTIDGFDRREAILLGDRPGSDILGGRAVSLRTCFFDPTGQSDGGADYAIRSLAQFPVLLKTL
ncbi:MAG: YjjG family noncanonical pyrimidine nucleotidase [Clostridia bacterium]|nr:YjjG family noncanonical pyrimidine nucleotidase [Clostridia bacterium]